MKKIRLTIEYDGTAYSGWQVQPNGLSIQELVEQALARVLGESVRLHSSGRTDAGVHARGMVAHFSTARQLPMAAYREGVNRLLPKDIAVREAVEVDAGFHARYSALGKWYRYTIYNDQVRSPLTERYAWHLRGALDVAAMKEAAWTFEGRHDFAAFRSSGCEARTTEREIFSLEVDSQEQFLYIDVKGSGFLKNMVRVMVGTLVDVGQCKRTAEDIARLLAGGCRKRSGRTAPPQGLCLMSVWY